MSAPSDPGARAEIEDLYLRYAEVLDEGELETWPELFTEDGTYRIVSRENRERGLPLATMLCEGRAAIQDRVHAIRATSFYLPRTLRHLIGPLRIRPAPDGFSVEANYAVFETLPEQETRVFSVGRYQDRLVRDRGGALRFAEKLCIYDSTLIPTSLILPL